MGINKNGTLSYRVNFNVGRSYFVSELAYYTWANRIEISTKNAVEGMAIVLLSIERYGYSGWRGSTDTEQSMGDQEVMVKYNEYYDKALMWMDEYLPQIKNK